jgi:hypothetical protein
MNFVFIDDLLGGFPHLEILERTTNRKNILLYQHEGTLIGDDKMIGNKTNVDERFRSFFVKAREVNADLVMTPEYSCPLPIIEEIIGSPASWPLEGKLWAVGSQSITKQGLQDFVAAHKSDTVSIYVEGGLFQDAKHYFDPLFYLFVTTHEGVICLKIIIQFKSKHMGVWGDGVVERNNLIEGKTIYVLRNSVTSIRLITLICSEAMNFQSYLTPFELAKLHWEDMPFLILNPMVNPQPAFPDFVAFRKFVFRSDNKEIIELNWNNESKLGKDKLLKYNASRSGIFVKSPDIDQKNKTRIRSNHALGMYYYFMGPRKYAFLMNGQPHVYHMATPPVNISGAQPIQSMREGPELLQTFEMNDTGTLKEMPVVSDDHIIYLKEIGCSNSFATDALGCVIDKERLACLTACEIPERAGPDWYLLDNLLSIKLDDTNEVNRRFTVSKDAYPDSKTQRKTFVRAINTLNNKILIAPNYFPESIHDLRTVEVRLGYATEKHPSGKSYIEFDRYKYNISTPDGKRLTATLCYLESPDLEELNLKFNHLQAMYDHNYNNRGRVVIFYEKDGNYTSLWDPKAGKYNNTEDNTGPSLFKDE